MSGMVFFGKFMRFLLAALCLAGVDGCSLSGSSELDEENEPHYILGKSRVNALDYPAAIDAFNESLQVNPHSAAAHYQLACLFDSEAKVADPAAAIYHYQEYLKFNPKAENINLVNQRIDNCKKILASSVNSLPSMPAAQKVIERLTATNVALQLQVDQWRAYFATQQAAANRPAPPPPQNNFNPITANEENSGGGTAPVPKPAPLSVPSRTHIVARGESFAIIARKAHVSLVALQAANPGVNPKKLRVGQTINLPVQ